MTLVRSFRAARHLLRLVLAPVSAAGVMGLAARGAYRLAEPLAITCAAVALLAATGRLVSRSRARQGNAQVAPMDGGAAAVLVALAFAVRSWLPGAALEPLPVVTVAAVCALAASRTSVFIAVFALSGELISYHYSGSTDVHGLAVRLSLIVVAGALHHGLTRAEIARVRAHAEHLLVEERTRQRDAARSFRLIAAPSAAPRLPSGDDERRVRGSLDEIRETLAGLLDLTRRAMALQTCAVYWLDSKGEALRLVEVATQDVTAMSSQPIAIGAGAVGGACAMGRPVILSRLRADYGGLTYYAANPGIRSFAAVPISDGGQVRGVLVADRCDERSFDQEEQGTLAVLATQTLRHVHNERVFGMLEKSKDELAKLFSASRALGEALTEDEVIAAVGQSVRRIVDHDLVVLATYDPRTHEHRVRHASGHGAAKFAGFVFADNAGIASAVVKTRHALPYRGHFDGRTQFVFTRETSLDGHESALCLPLMVRDRVLGTLTLAARRRGAFGDATRQLLGVLASHAAVALSNASAVRRLEEMATTDSMTGLLNKRALEAEFERRIRSAARFGKPLAVIVADIDKFKSVNDTYGHAVGDVVIKGLGAILANCKRETDAVARFGGEEFVIVCEETEIDGAYLLAERIRSELSKMVFAAETGPLSVTCSLGVAEFPRDGASKEDLFMRADEALYEAKRAGRNQTRLAGRRSSPVSAASKRPATRREAPAKIA